MAGEVHSWIHGRITWRLGGIRNSGLHRVHWQRSRDENEMEEKNEVGHRVAAFRGPVVGSSGEGAPGGGMCARSHVNFLDSFLFRFSF